MKLGFWNGYGKPFRPGFFQSANALPSYIINPSGLNDGALPSPWVGAAFAVSSGAIKNTPTEGSDTILNGGFADGTNWTPGTGWAIGSGVATATTASGNLVTTGYSPKAVSGWYKSTFDYTRTAATLNIGLFNSSHNLTAASASFDFDGMATNAAYSFGVAGAFSGTVDNVTCKRLTLNTLIASIPAGYINTIVKAAATWADVTKVIGVVANLDSQTSPANFIMGVMLRNGATNYGLLYKCVGGTMTAIVNFTAITYSAGANLEVRTRRSGSNLLCSLYYNNAAVGTEQTVGDAGIVSNTLHGIFSTNNANSIGTVSVAPNP